ncbi:MAG: hypothetical protein MI919_23405 [Holophagales bacterium]|nr:hypothetical protein [Holophagales bacterium]
MSTQAPKKEPGAPEKREGPDTEPEGPRPGSSTPPQSAERVRGESRRQGELEESSGPRAVEEAADDSSSTSFEAPSLAASLTRAAGGLPRRHGSIPVHGESGRTPTFEVAMEELPNRYEARDRDDGRRVLRCREAPGLVVSLDRRYAFTEPEARKLGSRAILLDGAGTFAPMVDDGAHLYNLDHHHGCSRAFTLATCEQALILVQKGLELDAGEWTVYANEPDLDTVLAIWVLLNHRRVRELDGETRDRIVPLIRLEGAIDANGFEIAELCGLPQALLKQEKQRLDGLLERELELKRSGEWAEMDLVDYTRELCLAVDRLVYRPSDFDDYTSVEEEYGHVDIGQGKVAVVCRDSGGIYDVEKRLKKVWSDRLGLIALEKESGHYTLRRTAALAGIDLAEAYDRLNLLDPVVDGRPPGKKWGGSDDIGGSPRPTGTGLTPREIGKILKLTYKQVMPGQRLRNLISASSWPLILGGLAWLVVFALRFFGWSSATARGELLETLAAGAVILVGAVVIVRQVSRGWIWLYGWRLPSGRDWLGLPVLVILAGLVGAAWVPAALPTGPDHLALGLGAVAVLACAIEMVFRGLVHGLLILDYRAQAVGGSWFVSKQNLIAAILFAFSTAIFASFWLLPPVWRIPHLPVWVQAGGLAFFSGLALGAIRERSLSIWPSVLALFAAGLARLAAGLWGA